MVLEPLSAFSVACNVLQIIEFGITVLSKAADLRASETGVSTEQKDLRDVLHNLHGLNADYQASLPRQTAGGLSAEEARLSEANLLCLRLSKDFIDFLDRLKLRDKHAILDSFRISIKTLWYKDRMVAMEKSLSQARNNLNVAFLVYINCRQATQATQDAILKSTTRVEGSILQVVESTSASLQEDIRSLAEQLSNVSLDSAQQTLTQFTTSHRDLLERLSKRLDSIFALQTNSRALSDETQIATARQNILDSLHFPQIRERKDHIVQAHDGTYRWILEPKLGQNQRWDDFISWLRSSPSESRIYWVSGKIGAGKSTLLHYVNNDRSLFRRTLPWTDEASVVRASYFFWNAGDMLQKSVIGLLRTFLIQLFEQTPDLVPIVVHSRKWQIALIAGNHITDWTESELKDCLREYILCVKKSKRVFLLVDGLDECEGDDEARESLIEFLTALATYDNVKICLSSRRWNIFQDAFEICPKLRLEDLTYDDVCIYVQQELGGNRRFCKLMEHSPLAAENLVKELIGKASGVFLWVRLVVRQMLNGLRDGDGIRALRKMVEKIPADLDECFKRLLVSIEPQNRKEASEFFQIALYDEHHFISAHSNYLLDFSFVEEGRPDFALSPSYDFLQLDFANSAAMAFRLESTMRKLNSRCMGLLECYDEGVDLSPLEKFGDNVKCDGDELTGTIARFGGAREVADLQDSSNPVSAAYFTVDVIHRSLRDFLLTPTSQDLLHQYSQGPYDARMFFRNARLVQLVALNRMEAGLPLAIGFVSYLASTLTVPNYRDTPSAAHVAALMRPVVENMTRYTREDRYGGWYVCCILEAWHAEGSTFLTLAIDFGLISYVRANLTPRSVQSKQGRPILDYLLRPRFTGLVGLGLRSSIAQGSPRLEFVCAALVSGADPNQSYHGVSVWALFLCFIADQSKSILLQSRAMEDGVYLAALTAMIQNGAHMLIPRRWLSSEALYSDDYTHPETADERFQRRFPSIGPRIGRDGTAGRGSLYAVSDVLEHFRHLFGSPLDTLKSLVMEREAQESLCDVDFVVL